MSSAPEGRTCRATAALPTFDELARLPDEAIDVATGAALVAKDVSPSLDVAGVLAEVARLAGPLPEAAPALARAPLLTQIDAVNARFRELGFRGNAEDYYDPRNSLLPDVLERRLGIPITLAIVWCELARRAGVTASGVAFPGHFLVRVDAPGAGPEAPRSFALVDAFDGGRVLDASAQAALLRQRLGAAAELHPSLLAPASPRAVLVRLLSNLKAIFASRGDHARAFVAIDRILTLQPDSARTLRERAGAALRLGAREIARGDLQRALELEPEAPDAPMLREQLAALGAPPLSRTDARKRLD